MEEPALDQYTYCLKCGDFVYEYCSIHGPLLVVPDNEVSSSGGAVRGGWLPRAALSVPAAFLHLALSRIPGAGVGVFSTLTLPRGVRFGPYRGKRTAEITSSYCWQIYDSNNKASHVVDAVDAERSNWMRYVNCARRWPEQNLVAFQYRGDIYYSTIKTIPRHTELLVFYGREFAEQLHIDVDNYNKTPVHKQTDTYESLKFTDGDDILFNFYEKNYIISESLTDQESNRNDLNTPSVGMEVDELRVDDQELDNDHDSILNLPDIKETEKNNQYLYKCDHCDKVYKLKSSLVRHTRSHFETKQNKVNTVIKDIAKAHKCSHCDFKTARRRSYFEHILRRHGLQPKSPQYRTYNCSMCSYRTLRQTGHLEHLNRHTKENKFTCDQCSYIGYTNRDYKRHLRKNHSKLTEEHLNTT